MLATGMHSWYYHICCRFRTCQQSFPLGRRRENVENYSSIQFSSSRTNRFVNERLYSSRSLWESLCFHVLWIFNVLGYWFYLAFHWWASEMERCAVLDNL